MSRTASLTFLLQTACSEWRSTQPLQSGIKRFSVLHPLLNTVQASFFNVWCLIDPYEVCFSHHTLWYGKSNGFLTVLSFTELPVVSVTTSATSNDKPPALRCFVHNDSVWESSGAAEKTEGGFKARPAISSFISLLSVPRYPWVRVSPVFILLNAASCLAHFAASDTALSPSVWQNMNKCVPVLHAAHVWTVLHITAPPARLPPPMINWKVSSNQSAEIRLHDHVGQLFIFRFPACCLNVASTSAWWVNEICLHLVKACLRRLTSCVYENIMQQTVLFCFAGFEGEMCTMLSLFVGTLNVKRWGG